MRTTKSRGKQRSGGHYVKVTAPEVVIQFTSATKGGRGSLRLADCGHYVPNKVGEKRGGTHYKPAIARCGWCLVEKGEDRTLFIESRMGNMAKTTSVTKTASVKTVLPQIVDALAALTERLHALEQGLGVVPRALVEARSNGVSP
jgi:hypothetical protein